MRKLVSCCLLTSLMLVLVIFSYGNVARSAIGTESPQFYSEVTTNSKSQVTNLYFPNTLRRLNQGQQLTIVCIGSSSTQGYPGYGAFTPSETYPGQLRVKLHKAFPKSKIIVFNKGIAGNTITQMLNRFPSDVYKQHPELVIWQTGTIEAMEGANYNVYVKHLVTGIKQLKAHHYDILLLDSQYYPGKGETPTYQKYIQGMKSVGNSMGVPVFQRYNYMVNLVETRQYSWDQLLYKDKKHPSALMYELTAQYITDMIKANDSTAKHRN